MYLQQEKNCRNIVKDAKAKEEIKTRNNKKE